MKYWLAAEDQKADSKQSDDMMLMIAVMSELNW